MFKKLYKEANDEIPVNTELLAKLRKEAAKEKKHPPYSFIYKYGFAAAAVLIITVSLSVLPKLKIPDEKQLPQKQYAANPLPISDSEVDNSRSDAETSEKTENISESEKTASTTEKKQNTTTAPTRKSGNLTEHADKNQTPAPSANAESAQLPQDRAADAAADNVQTPDVVTDTASAPKISSAEDSADSLVRSKESGALSGGGSSSGSAANMAAINAESAPAAKQQSIDAENFAVPDGMHPVHKAEPYATGLADNGADTNPIFTYYGADKNLIITVFPGADDVAQAMSRTDGESYSSGKLVTHSDSAITAYVIKNNVGYVIESYGLTKEEVHTLMDSIN